MIQSERVRIGDLLRRPIHSRQFILDGIKYALETGSGYAAGKLGPSELHWMIYPVLKEQGTSRIGMLDFEKKLKHHALKNSGLFPADLDFYLQYNNYFVPHVMNMDSLGVFLNLDRMENVVIGHYGLHNLVHFMDQEPDRSIPQRPDRCYLPFFRGKKILLICPFAKLLKQRANKSDFDGVWAKTGKKWFYPETVDAIEFPYGFSTETHLRYSTVLNLIDEIHDEIRTRKFDIALIGAGGIAIPLASTIKDMGKIAIDLGGHLQVLFGVIGKRWREEGDWADRYFTDSWIDMPTEYRPKEIDVCDHGAYW